MAAVCALAWMSAQPAHSLAEDYPYTAYIVGERAEVLSGPSRRFYITHQLYFGDAVEVYKRDAAGWLGIRPPEDSFSWIPADAVEETDEKGIFRVLEETPAWVGTPIEAIQDHKFQVKVRAGELVEVIGERKLRTAEGEETWLKILPPAGEFRWIHLNQVSKTPPREQELAAAREVRSPHDAREVNAAIGTGVRKAKESLNALRTASAEGPLKPPAHDVVQTKLGSREKNEIQLVENKEPVNPQPLRPRDPNLSPDGFVPRKPRKLDTVAGVPAPSTELRMASREQLQNSIYDRGGGTSKTPSLAPAGASGSAAIAATSAVPAKPISREPLPAFDAANASDQLTKLDLELSLRVAQPRETWNLEGIRNQAQRIVDGGPSPQERGQARLLLEKIRKFEETFQLPNDPLLAAQPKGIAGASPAEARYDGVGLLQPVLTRDGQKAIASYALVDSEGNPVAFVTPGPGLNLRRYENKPVGIYGKRGMVEALKKPHLLAERVIDLSVR